MKHSLKIFLRVIVCCFFLWLLNGCFSYPEMPDTIESSSYSPLKSGQQRRLPENCKVLTLDLAKQISIANNPDYLSAKFAITAAWARFYSAASGYLPTITANYAMTEYQHTPGMGGINVYDTKGGSIQGQWVIFDGLITTMNMLAARYGAKQAESLNRDARRTLILGVINGYNTILLSQARIKIAKEDELFNEENYRESEIKYKAGAVPLTDPLNFRVKANTAKSARIQQEYNYQINRDVLAELLGFTEGTIPDSVAFPEIKIEIQQFPIDVTVYLDTALKNRPDLQSFREALAVAKYQLWASYGAFLPTISLNATPLGYSRTDQGYSGRYHIRPHGNNRMLNYGFSASWVLFNGGQNIANVRLQQALLAQSQLDLIKKWIQVISEVRQAYENCKQSAKQVDLFRENLALYQKTRDLVEEEYKAGNTSITHLNEAQRDLVQAENDLVSYQINFENAKAQLKAAIGEE